MDRIDSMPDEGPADERLVQDAVGGDQTALEQLVRRHQGWIYQLAVRMVWDRHDAEDVTQEILIKVITKLGSFRGDSALRTWMYRIASNHVLTMRQRHMEAAALTFPIYGGMIDGMPDHELPARNTLPVDHGLLVQETKTACILGMLMCLDRRQRLVFVLGDSLGVGDTVGAELLEVSPENFRQLLSRARRDLYNFMNSKCGLVDPKNPCRCARKTKAMIAAGHVDPHNLRFAPARVAELDRRSQSGGIGLDAALEKASHVYQQLAELPAPDRVPLLRELLSSGRFQHALELS